MLPPTDDPVMLEWHTPLVSRSRDIEPHHPLCTCRLACPTLYDGCRSGIPRDSLAMANHEIKAELLGNNYSELEVRMVVEDQICFEDGDTRRR
jgi:hypothetical protein